MKEKTKTISKLSNTLSCNKSKTLCGFWLERMLLERQAKLKEVLKYYRGMVILMRICQLLIDEFGLKLNI